MVALSVMRGGSDRGMGDEIPIQRFGGCLSRGCCLVRTSGGRNEHSFVLQNRWRDFRLGVVVNLLKKAWLNLRIARRLGAFGRARKNGMSVEEARAYSDGLYPLTAEEAAYEEFLRQKEMRNSD